MPIVGLTDRASLEPRYPILGKLRKGSKKRKNEKGQDIFGEELPYFRFTGEGPSHKQIERAFYTKFGPQPYSLHVILPYATAEENFQTCKEKWRGSKARILEHRCDGEMTTLIRRQDGSYSKEPVPCPGGCSQIGRLNVVIPELLKVDLIGTVTIETHSTHDLVNIANMLARAEMDAANHGATLEGMNCIVYRSREQARSDVFDYIERFYNPTRRHSTLGYVSPIEFEQARKA